MRTYSQEDFEAVVNDDGVIEGVKDNTDYYVKEKVLTNSFPFLRMNTITHYKLIDGEWVEQDN